MKISEYVLLAKRLGIVFLLFPFSRILFYVFNLNYFGSTNFETILAFMYGLRFDISSVLIANFIFIFFSLIPYRSKIYNTLLKTIFLIFNIIPFGLNIVDIEYFDFNGKKLTKDILGIAGDINDQAFQIFINYWPYSVLIILTGFLLNKYYPTGVHKEMKLNVGKLTGIILLPLLLILSFVGIRGGVQMRSISPKQAFIFEKYENGNLAINSFYTLVRSLEQQRRKPVAYFKHDSEAVDIIKQQYYLHDSIVNKKQRSTIKNVIIIIMESFSQEYLDKGYAPFLSSLGKQGLYFSNNYANGRRSIEALPSILIGVPSLLGEPISQSSFQTNKWHSLPEILKTHGFKSSFFHGGKRGTMDFDAFTRSLGILNYFGKEDYPNQKHFDGHWGIYDHHFFEFMGEKAEKEEGPFLYVFFSLSSHQPYSIPKEFQGRFPKGKLPIHESIGYADQSLKLFFESFREKKWFKETLFVITADHTQKLEEKGKNHFSKYRVPLIFYTESNEFDKKEETKLTQHISILPTTIDILGINPPQKLLFAKSIFDQNQIPIVVRRNDQLLFLNSSIYSEFDITRGMFKNSISNGKDESNLIFIKAYFQYFMNGLIKNNLYQAP